MNTIFDEREILEKCPCTGTEHNTEYVRGLPYEIYVCRDCGGVFDWDSPKNYAGAIHPMNAKELLDLVRRCIRAYSDVIDETYQLIRQLHNSAITVDMVDTESK